MSLWVVVGGQYGSEGKGKVSAFITKQEDIDICVRCGGPNSGHSFVNENGKTVVLRQLSTGYVNPRTRLLIPAGAQIDPVILRQEMESLDLRPQRIGIDRNALIIDERDREEERRLHLRERLSSTLCGVGAAQARRVLRGSDVRLAKDVVEEHSWLRECITDVSNEVNAALDQDMKVLVEGTQGFGLSLYHSEHYPKTTSRDTTAAGFLSEVGVSPRLVTEIVVVFRTFPIRVAGEQAGPLKYEITWDQLQRESGYPHSIEERTTVTNKVRRIARFDFDLAKKAVDINRPTKLALNGLDYLDYKSWGVRTCDALSNRSLAFLKVLKTHVGMPIDYVGVGPKLSDLLNATEIECHASELSHLTAPR
jgi:adenylosuccinate synthase